MMRKHCFAFLIACHPHLLHQRRSIIHSDSSLLAFSFLPSAQFKIWHHWQIFWSQSPQLWSQRKLCHCEYICTAAIFRIMISHSIFNLFLLISFVMSLVCSYLCPSVLLHMTFLSSQELKFNASFSISFKVHCLCLTFCPPSCPDFKYKPTLNPFTSHKYLSLVLAVKMLKRLS